MTRPPGAAAIRADLEGLRGIAVALVVLFHAKLLGLVGGYVGVDAFYVLSGFLITGLLLGELAKSGGIDLAAFYARRARRILPAATVAIVATLVAAAFVIAPLDLPLVASDATAAALFVSNIHFALQATDYFASTTPSPFVHFWSLAVEEQFYLLWPVLLLIAARWRRVGTTMAIVFVLSLALSIVLTPISGPWAFYNLPTRAWELALGGVVALQRPRLDRLPAWVVTPAGWAGLALLIAAAFVLDPATPYPGLAAMLPTFGVAVLIAAGERPFGPGRFVSLAPLRALGRVSYSVYLYHWPVLVFAGIVGAELSTVARWSFVGVAVLAGALSWRLVEEPFRLARRASLRPARSLLLAATAIGVVVAASSGLGSNAQAGLSERVVAIASEPAVDATGLELPADRPMRDAMRPGTPDAQLSGAPAVSPAPATPREVRPRLADARRDGDGLNERGCGLSLAGTKPPVCELGAADGATTVALVGDSHAAQWFPSLDVIARERSLRLIPFTKDSCIFIDMAIVSIHLEREYHECAAWRREVLTVLLRIKPDLVIVSSSRWVHPVSAIDKDPRRQADAMARLLRLLPGKVALLADTPLSAVDVPACLSQKRAEACATSRGYALTAHLARDARAAQLAGAALIDPSPWLCGEQTCPAILDYTIVYRDDHHLTATFARALAPRLVTALGDVMPSPQAAIPASKE